MNAYWDLMPWDRANLTEEQVQSFISVELMTKGIVKLEPPPPPASTANLPTVELWAVCICGEQVAFVSKEKALAFIDLDPMEIKSDYKIGYDVRFAAVPKLKVEPKRIVLERDVEERRSQLEGEKARKDEIEKRRSEYDANAKAIREATAGVWKDWHEQRGKASEHLQILRTFEEYKALAKDDRLALRFLHKAYTADKISRAAEWLSRDDLD